MLIPNLDSPRANITNTLIHTVRTDTCTVPSIRKGKEGTCNLTYRTCFILQVVLLSAMIGETWG